MAASANGAAPELSETKPEPLKWNKDDNIHVRMIRAQADAKALEKVKPKDGEKGFLQNGYISHDAVTHEAARLLPKHGIHFQPYLKSHKQEGNRTEVEMEGVFTNVDKPEERLSFLGFGYGIDSSDKGPGKAMSYAKKMVLSQALMMNTHEDIEDHNNKFEPETKTAAQKEAEALTEATLRSWGDAYKAALDGCKTLKDLKRIRAENASMMNHPGVPQVTKDYFIDKITALQDTLE